MPQRFCASCGHRLGESASFCGGCGVAVPPEESTPPAPAVSRARPALVTPQFIGALVAALFVLFTFFGSESRRQSAIRFIDQELYEPVAAITPRNTIGEFYSRVSPSCDVAYYDFRTGTYQEADCPSNNLFMMLFRVPGAILGTAGYVLSQGPVAVVVVGIPAVLFCIAIVAGVSDDVSSSRGGGTLFNPFSWMFTWLVAFPLFTGLFAWAVQLLILAILLMLKSLIAALAFIGIAYVLFEKFKLWDEMRKLFERGAARVGGKRPTQQAG